jgi:hypothetical protein
MLDPACCEMRLVVGLVVQPNDALDIVVRKVAEDTPEALVEPSSLLFVLYPRSIVGTRVIILLLLGWNARGVGIDRRSFHRDRQCALHLAGFMGLL